MSPHLVQANFVITKILPPVLGKILEKQLTELKKKKSRAGKIAWQAKVLAAKPGDLRSVPGMDPDGERR